MACFEGPLSENRPGLAIVRDTKHFPSAYVCLKGPLRPDGSQIFREVLVLSIGEVT